MIPNKLKPGETIGVIAPSDPVRPNQEEKLQAGKIYLEGLGLKVKLGQHIRKNTLGFGAAPEEKVRDIHEMFSDPTVKAIICAQGGSTANATLPLIDYELIQQNPKIFLGLSDITVLLNAIYAKTGLLTFHGSDILWGFGNDLAAYERDAFVRALMAGEIGPIPPNRPRMTIRRGQARGKLLGGNIGCLLKLAGTPYWPNFSGGILFLEAYEISPSACHSAFHQLKQLGLFTKIQGAVIGYIDSMQRDGLNGPQMEDILLQVTQYEGFPILKINDFGHNCPNTVLPVGGEVFLDADQQTLEIVSPCVL